MKNSVLTVFALSTVLFFSCNGGKSNIERIRAESMMEPENPAEAWKSNHGIGPVKAFELPADVDQSLVKNGQEIFLSKCTACHKPDKKFIGPAPIDILSRRNPAWVMNMILNPDEMTLKDPIAKQLLIEANGSPMANQSLTEAEARAVLEYFRTL